MLPHPCFGNVTCLWGWSKGGQFDFLLSNIGQVINKIEPTSALLNYPIFSSPPNALMPLRWVHSSELEFHNNYYACGFPWIYTYISLKSTNQNTKTWFSTAAFWLCALRQARTEFCDLCTRMRLSNALQGMHLHFELKCKCNSKMLKVKMADDGDFHSSIYRWHRN